ncbi:MAG: diguanylate cyclase, partial [Omnitrophica bacterium]|nr:diguanylate cyclase [Candidatus Omnitrophota bacterium]
MQYLNYVFAANAIITLLAGVGIYIFRRKRLQSSVWLVYNILLSTWSYCLYEAAIQTKASLATYWVRTSLIPLIFLVPVFLHFLSIYSDRRIFQARIIRNVYIVFFLIFVTSFVIPKEFIKGMLPNPFFNYVASPGLAFKIFSFVFIGFIFCGFYYLLRPSKKAYLEFRRNQRIWIFFGMLCGIMAPLNFIFASYKLVFFPFGAFFILPYLAVTGYAIAKYHVPEVNILFKKVKILSYLVLFVIAIHTVVVLVLHKMLGVKYFESSVISGCIILLNILLTVHYGRLLKFNKLTESVVYKRRLAYYKFLENFNSMVKEAKDLDTLLTYIVDSLMNIIGMKCAMLYLLDEESSSYRLKVLKGIGREAVKEIDTIPAASPLIDFLKDGNIFVTYENNDFSQDYNLEAIRKVFNRINVRLTMPLRYSLPLYHGRDVVAFLNLGNKKDNTEYQDEDIDILNAFGRELSFCVDKAKLFVQVITDDLTNLYRHSYFYKRLDEEIERSKRYDRVFSIVLVDIDDFKKINDVFGHRVGDAVLKKIAILIKSNLRKVDIAARYGGEEFGILLPVSC